MSDTPAPSSAPDNAIADANPWPAWAEKLVTGPWPLAAVALYLALMFGQLHFSHEGMVERDGFYHARVSQQFFERGLSRTFPWTQASTWKDSYCDKEFIFHALMAPFTQNVNEPIGGAKLFMLLLNLGVFAALYLLLRKHGARWPLLFAFALACMGGLFLDRLVMVRSHVLSTLLTLIGIHFLMRGHWKALGVLGFVFAWSYTFPLALVLTAVPFTAGRFLGGGGIDWRAPLAALVGVLAGLIIHPFTPLTLEMFMTIVEIIFSSYQGARGSGPELGMEFLPLSTRSLVLAYPLLILAFGGLLLGGWKFGRRMKPESMGALTAALAWMFAGVFYSRFLAEYAAPLMVVAVAMAVRDALEGVDLKRRLLRPHPGICACATAILFTLLAGLHAFGLDYVWEKSKLADPPRFKGASAWMAKHLKAGETVVNLWWDDFPDLYYHGYRQHYLVGLDPTFMVRYDAEKAKLLEDMRTGRRPLDGPLLAKTFRARYMVMRRRVALSYPALTNGTWGFVHQDPNAVIYALDGPEGPRVPPPTDPSGAP